MRYRCLDGIIHNIREISWNFESLRELMSIMFASRVQLCWTYPTTHISHIPYTFQNRNVYISDLNGALWNLGQVHCGICESGLLGANNSATKWPHNKLASFWHCIMWTDIPSTSGQRYYWYWLRADSWQISPLLVLQVFARVLARHVEWYRLFSEHAPNVLNC